MRKGSVLALGVMRDDFSEDVYIVAELSSARKGLDAEEIKRGVIHKVNSAIGLSPVVVLVPKGSIPRTPSGKLSPGAHENSSWRPSRVEQTRSPSVSIVRLSSSGLVISVG